MGSKISSTLKLGIALLNGGNATVQQVEYSVGVSFKLWNYEICLGLPSKLKLNMS